MTPSEFAAKWSASKVKETAGSKEHFADLCRMLGYPTPVEADPDGEWYAYEKGAEKTGGTDGFADVWKRGHFGWEYKGKKKDLGAAYKQLLDYREALENPPLLVVSDMNRVEVHTNFTNTAKVVHAFDLEQLAADPREPLRILRAVMGNPDVLRPTQTREEITGAAAREFATLAISIRDRGAEPERTAHFLNKLLFTMFAEDVELLPPGLIGRLATATAGDPPAFARGLSDLFAKMSETGGLFGTERIQWFNGGLFDGDDVIELTVDEIKTVAKVSKLDWAQVEPAIFGTLFERGLDPSKRAQLGAHYTDRAAIERLVNPVVIDPLRREFEELKERIAAIGPQRPVTVRTPLDKHPRKQLDAFLDRVRSITVLDPACGSGNFLYIALQALKDLEREVIIWGSTELRMSMHYPAIGPEAVKGIELNSYAAEIARVVIWIGEIQWMINNGFAYRRNPILRPLDNIENRDALLETTDEGEVIETDWPDATFIVGNPPFIGGSKLRAAVGNEYVEHVFRIFGGRLPNFSDFVCYWHEKARAMVEAGRVEKVGLLATQGIRGGANRRVLDRIKQSGDIYMAWSDELWVLEGAAVHVSFIAYDDGSEPTRTLNGQPVVAINSNLTAGFDLGLAKPLRENRNICFMGPSAKAPFDISAEVAEAMLAAPLNVNGRPNSDVVRRVNSAIDLVQRDRGKYTIDFALMSVDEAAPYEMPFEYVREHVLPVRSKNRRDDYRGMWWQYARPRPEMRAALRGLPRFITTPGVSKHRIFVWRTADFLCNQGTLVFARDDDFTFGVLHSRAHELWARGMGTQLREVESGFRYTPTTTFETFPFPEPSDEQRQAVGAAAEELNRQREDWLNPPGAEADVLLLRTLTRLYNERPTWLSQAHERLDAVVLDAYGWQPDLSDEELLSCLLELNQERASVS